MSLTLDSTPLSNKEQRYTLEEGRPLSQSALWPILQHEAMRGRRPPLSYAHQTPQLATAYAHMIRALLRDLALPTTASVPLTILELDAESGHFSHLLIRTLERLLLPLYPSLQWHYITSDHNPHYSSFWESHPQLAPYMRSGHLSTLHLKTHTPSLPTIPSSPIPLIVIANDVFNHCPIDLLRAAGPSVEYASPTLTSTRFPSLHEVYKTKSPLSSIHYSQHFTPLTSINALYTDKAAAALAEKSLAQATTNFPAPFPIGAINLLNSLMNQTKHALFVLGADATANNLTLPLANENLGSSLELSHLHSWASQAGGTVYTSPSSASLHTSCIHWLPSSSHLQDTWNVFSRPLTPSHTPSSIPVHFAAFILEKSDHDPFLCRGFDPTFFQALRTLPLPQRSAICLAVHECWKNLYYHPSRIVQETAIAIATTLEVGGACEAALDVWSFILACYTPSSEYYYRQAVCFCKIDSFSSALSALEQCLALDPPSNQAQELHHRLIHDLPIHPLLS